jgi:hypothetical protein
VLSNGLDCSRNPHHHYNVVSAAGDVSRRSAKRFQEPQKLTLLLVNSLTILNGHPQVQVLSGAFENALAESESTLLSSRGVWEHLEVLRITSEVVQNVCKD